VSRQAQAGRHTAKAAGRVGGGRKPEDDSEGRPEGRTEAKGASPEWKSDLKGTGKTGSQEPVRNGRPGDWFQAQAGRQRKGTPRQDQRAGQRSGRRKPSVEGQAGGRIQRRKPEDREPEGSGRRKLAATRGAGRKAGAGRIGTSLRADAEGLT